MEISWHLVVKMANLSHRPEKNGSTEMFLTERQLLDKDDLGERVRARTGSIRALAEESGGDHCLEGANLI